MSSRLKLHIRKTIFDKGGNTVIMLGTMFLLIGILVITGTYIIYAYVIIDMMNDPVLDATIMMLIVPGILLAIFLSLVVTAVIKLLRDTNWRPLYLASMVVYVISLIITYVKTPEPLRDLLIFTTFCFVFSTLLLLIGFYRMSKRKPVDS